MRTLKIKNSNNNTIEIEKNRLVEFLEMPGTTILSTDYHATAAWVTHGNLDGKAICLEPGCGDWEVVKHEGLPYLVCITK